ncbi:hypothetical protein STAS_17613 [Striga asiatica]|uniref:FAF domain-containing protein n=1 Tax=Striga asiatica TaxID=4170 RepID=A0A5A7Q7P8_STRAF|nr:hypothetical protein STAS_17613 [Striga asiatica]
MPSTNPNAMRDECWISSTQADKNRSFNFADEYFLKNEVLTNNNGNKNGQSREERETQGLTRKELKRSRSYGVGDFPPPISCIGKCGKPFVSFRSFRQDGRFILKEIRIQELMHVQRENGRLKLQFIQSDDDDEEDGDNYDDGAIGEDGKVERFEKIQ